MKKIYLLFILLGCGQGLWAQSGMSAIGYPSTNTNFLGQIGTTQQDANVDVDLYTGAALMNINICNLPGRDFNIPVSLSYTGGHGIKLQQYAGDVGLGWQLGAGGSITRVVRGFPDEQPNGYVGGGWGGVIVNNWLPQGYSAGTATGLTTQQAEALMGINSTGQPTADGEPDLFNVQTPFFSFQFVLDWQGNAVIGNSNGITVVYNRTAQSFVVTDANGNQFYFASNINNTESTTTTLYGQLSGYISTWYLDKIVTYNSKDVINLNYISSNDGSLHSDTTYHYQWTEVFNGTGTSMDSTPVTTVVQYPKYVSSIVSSQGEIDFSYVWDRKDDKGAARLSTIIAKAYNSQTNSNSTTLQTYTFNTSYFGSPSTDATILRLRLDNVTVTGNTSATSSPLTLYSFGYNQDNAIPSRRSGAFDYWGYTSQSSENVFYSTPSAYYEFWSQIRAPNTVMAKVGILQSVNTLRGENWTIDYESNDYQTNTLVTLGGLRVKTLTRRVIATGEQVVRSYSYKDANGNSTGTILSPNYNVLSASYNGTTIYFSESPYLTSDLNGLFVGYSMVTVSEPNKGKTVYTFTNFNTTNASDVLGGNLAGAGDGASYVFSSSTDLSWRRGLLLDELQYDANNNKVQEITNTYTTQNPSGAGQGAQAYRPFNFQAILYYGGGQKGYADYYTTLDNFRLATTTRYDYDQSYNGNKTQRTTTYTYDPPDYRLVSQTSTTDSKTNAYKKNFYYPWDAISLSSGQAEQQALTAMVNANKKDVLIQETDTRNQTVTSVHNIYNLYSTGQSTSNVYQAYSDIYNGATMEKRQTFNFDPASSLLISTGVQGGKSTSIQYGYNGCYPTAKVVNATASATYSTYEYTASGSISAVGIPQTFTSYYTGNFVFTLNSTTQGAGVDFDLTNQSTGQIVGNSSLCYGTVCGATTSTHTFSNLPPGTYSVTLTSVSSNFSGSSVSWTYPSQGSSGGIVAEFFFQGFEEGYGTGPGAVTAHTGSVYYGNNYNVPFTMPDSRNYTIQWWNLVSGAWVFNQQAYSNGMTLTGPVDDVRIFPSDALMTTYTYNPMVGKTSETDPAGHTRTYEYDGLNRLLRIRDQDGNILKQFDYEYQTALHQ